MTDLTVCVSKIISAPAETLFDAWLDPDRLARFMLPKPGMPNPKVTCDPVVGGEFEILMDTGDQIVPHNGVYRIIERHTKIQFTWNSPFSTPDSIVTVEFRDLDDGNTEITINHVKFPSQESRDNHESGWSNILNVLESLR